MKYTTIVLLQFFWNVASTQIVDQINDVLNIQDTFFKKEIRIYNAAAITNGRSIFRLYQNDENKWIVEFTLLNYFPDKPQNTVVKKVQIFPKTKFDIFWLKIIDTDIEFLPEWSTFEYKLKQNGEIILDRGKYELTWSKKQIMDGTSYFIIIRNGEKFNSVNYSNPKQYFKYYPNVDELEAVNKLLDLIENEFDLRL